MEKKYANNHIGTECEIYNDDGTLSEQQILTLPTLRQAAMNNLGKVLIETRHKISSDPILRYHIFKTKTSTEPTIAKNIKPPKMNVKDLKR